MLQAICKTPFIYAKSTERSYNQITRIQVLNKARFRENFSTIYRLLSTTPLSASTTPLTSPSPTSDLPLTSESSYPSSTSEDLLSSELSMLTDEAVNRKRIITNLNMTKLRRQQKLLQCLSVYHEFLQQKIQPDAYIYSTVLSLYADLHYLQDAMQLFDQIVERARQQDALFTQQSPPFNIDPQDPVHFRVVPITIVNAMLHLYTELGQSHLAQSLLQKHIILCNLKPDVMSLHPILKSLCRRNVGEEEVDSFWNYTQHVLGSDSIDVRFYNTLLDYYGRNRNYSKLKNLFLDMKRLQMHLDPTIISILLRYLSGIDVETTSMTIKELQERHELGIDNYNVMAKEITEVEEIHTLVSSLLANGATPDAFTYNTIISRSSQTPEQVRYWMQHMKKQGVAPDTVTYNTLLKILAKPAEKWKVPEVESVLDEMQDQAVPVSDATYCIMIRFYSLIQDSQKAQSYVNRYWAQFPPTPYFYNAVIQFYLHGGKHRNLLGILDQIQGKENCDSQDGEDIWINYWKPSGQAVLLPSRTVGLVCKYLTRGQKWHYLLDWLKYAIKNAIQIEHRLILTVLDCALQMSRKSIVPGQRQPLNDVIFQTPFESSVLSNLSAETKRPHLLRFVIELHQFLQSGFEDSLRLFPLEYWKYVLLAQYSQISHAAGTTLFALELIDNVAEKIELFKFFLKLMEANSIFYFKDDIETWMHKLSYVDQLHQHNPLLLIQIRPFLIHVQKNNIIPNTVVYKDEHGDHEQIACQGKTNEIANDLLE